MRNQKGRGNGPRPCKKVVICYVPGRRPVQRYPVRHSDPARTGALCRYGSAPDCCGDILLDYPPQQEAVTQPYPSDLLATALVCVTKLQIGGHYVRSTKLIHPGLCVSLHDSYCGAGLWFLPAGQTVDEALFLFSGQVLALITGPSWFRLPRLV